MGLCDTWVTVIAGRGEKEVNRRQRDRGRRVGERGEILC
jgi:hypothetical protein